MFAKGPQPGRAPKQDALALLPAETRCQHMEAMGIRGYVVTLANGNRIASAGNASQAWEKALDWARRHL
jgi:hypothetical protein